MNRLEFNEVMKAVGINNPLSTTNGSNGTSEQVHYWQNIAIYFGGSYYAVIKGKVPLEVANIIYEKYPNNPYKIRVDGGCSDWIPIKHATDEKLEQDIRKYIDQNLSENEYKTARRNYLRRTNKNKYVPTYHIDTKEGLVILLTEMKDYFARKKRIRETEVQRFDELMVTINAEILKKVKPSISAYEWMQADEENNEIFSQTVSSGTKTSFGKEFRKAIDEFDKVVNPFINEDIELDEIGNYLQKVNISANTYDSVDLKTRKDCCEVVITDLETQNKVLYRRNPDGFLYQLQYTFEKNRYLVVSHYYSTAGSDENDKGEVITIDYYGDNVPQEIDIRYNLTKGVAGKTYGERTPITLEQKEFVYDELLKAIGMASSITIDNMKKKGYSKQLIPNNK